MDICYLITSGMSGLETSKEAVEEGLDKLHPYWNQDTIFSKIEFPPFSEERH